MSAHSHTHAQTNALKICAWNEKNKDMFGVYGKMNKLHVILASRYSQQARQQLITIQDSCLKRLKHIINDPDKQLLRIHVDTGGCSGFSYRFELVSDQKVKVEEDTVFEREQYKVVVNKSILPLISGSKIEYSDSLMKSSFEISNPIAETKCGCGTSFSVNLDKLQSQNTSDK